MDSRMFRRESWSSVNLLERSVRNWERDVGGRGRVCWAVVVLLEVRGS